MQFEVEMSMKRRMAYVLIQLYTCMQVILTHLEVVIKDRRLLGGVNLNYLNRGFKG